MGTVLSLAARVEQRRLDMLHGAMGDDILAWMADPAIVEIMCNPDGRLWTDRLAEGLGDTGQRLSPAAAGIIVYLVASHVGAEVTPTSPRVSAERPESGARFEGLIPPIVTAPAFAIRKPARAVFTLDHYADAGIMTPDQAAALRHAVAERRNILVAGGTSSGKTTLTNALLAEVAQTSDRVVIIEDTRELQRPAPNLVDMRTKEGVASLSDLGRSLLRMPADEAMALAQLTKRFRYDRAEQFSNRHDGGAERDAIVGGIGKLQRVLADADFTPR